MIRLRDCSHENEFKELVLAFPDRFDFGYNKVFPNITDKEDLIKTIAHHCIISRQMEEIQQFLDGLSSNGVLKFLRKHPLEARNLFMFNKKLITAEGLKAIMNPIFSSETDESEEDIVFNFYNFIDEVGNNKLTNVLAFSLADVEDGKVDDKIKQEVSISLSDLLMFLTGSRHLPRCSPRISICFDHQIQGRVNVSTCNMEIRFSVTKRYVDSAQFSENFLQDIINSPGFGKV